MTRARTSYHEMLIVARWCKTHEAVAKELDMPVELVRRLLVSMGATKLPHKPFDLPQPSHTKAGA